MSSTGGSGSGGGTGFSFSSLLGDVTNIGMSYAAARGLDVNNGGAETVPGIENGYYGVNGAPGASTTSSILPIVLIGAAALLAFVAVKHLR